MKTFLVLAVICIMAGIVIGTTLWEREVRIAKIKQARDRAETLERNTDDMQSELDRLWEIQRENKKVFEGAVKSAEASEQTFDVINGKLESQKEKLESILIEQREIDFARHRTPY